MSQSSLEHFRIVDADPVTELVVEEFAQELRITKKCLKMSYDQTCRLVAMFCAVGSAANFIESFPKYRKELLSLPFRQLQEAIDDILHGIKPQDFEIQLVTRSRDHSGLLHFKTKCAVAMHLHMNNGKGRAEAARAVSRKLVGHNINPNTIAQWRDKFKDTRQGLWADRYRLAAADLAEKQLTENQIDRAVARIATSFQGIRTKKRTHILSSAARKPPR
jgi:transposase-like protein